MLSEKSLHDPPQFLVNLYNNALTMFTKATNLLQIMGDGGA